MNVGENRVRNGVTDCPESRNEENYKDIMLWDSSRYAKYPKYLRVPNCFAPQMADENTYGGSSSCEKVELTETQVMVKEEVAKAFGSCFVHIY
ncbi:hypothetical protein E3N88_38839 [Mikania micrantha]|uniref:Uncharacterized protein n=1 Tax=Mikania micrantha TaxID=192012 RepID=A0A5N6LXN5_9ASTR|nr:hypothetical protein E3N88_38839 [Mikania micrantha]